MITPFYAAVMTIMYSFLSLKIIRLRWKHKVGIGDGDISELRRAIRVHGNFSEYAALAIILLFFLESSYGYHRTVFVLGMALILSRLSHALGLWAHGGATKRRVFGTAVTLSVLNISAFLLIYEFVKDKF